MAARRTCYCGKPIRAANLCNGHYYEKMKIENPDNYEKIRAKQSRRHSVGEITRPVSAAYAKAMDDRFLAGLMSKVGEVKGHLTVIGVERPSDAPNRMLKCLCVCGNVTFIQSGHWSRGKAASCGCKRLELNRIRMKGLRKPPGESGLHRLLDSYIRGAAKRNIRFELTRQEFKDLTSSCCAYCGIPPNRVSFKPDSSGNTKEATELTKYVHHGVDRVDSNLGYILSNCVPSCTKCNVAKASMSVSEFRDWLTSVYNNFVIAGDRL